METGIREAKNNLSKLVEAAVEGQEVFLTNRGKRVARIIPAPPSPAPKNGRGMFKDKGNLYPGWDSIEEDKKIEDMFEFLHENNSE
jgi:prevent-host-death family protein